MNETSVRPAESNDAPWEASWPCSTPAHSSSMSICSDTAKVELAPAVRREGDDGVVKVIDGLNIIDVIIHTHGRVVVPVLITFL